MERNLRKRSVESNPLEEEKMNTIWKVGCWASVFVLAIIAVTLLFRPSARPDIGSNGLVHQVAMQRNLPDENNPYLGSRSIDERGRPTGLPENPR